MFARRVAFEMGTLKNRSSSFSTYRLLEINLAEPDAQHRLAEFLETDPAIAIPRLNASA